MLYEIILGINDQQMQISEPNVVWLLMRTILALAIIIGMIYGAMFLMKRYVKAGNMIKNTPDLMRMVAIFQVEPRKKLIIMKIINNYFLIACTETSIQLLHILSNEEGTEELRHKETK